MNFFKHKTEDLTSVATLEANESFYTRLAQINLTEAADIRLTNETTEKRREQNAATKSSLMKLIGMK